MPVSAVLCIMTLLYSPLGLAGLVLTYITITLFPKRESNCSYANRAHNLKERDANHWHGSSILGEGLERNRATITYCHFPPFSRHKPLPLRLAPSQPTYRVLRRCLSTRQTFEMADFNFETVQTAKRLSPSQKVGAWRAWRAGIVKKAWMNGRRFQHMCWRRS